NTGYGFENGDNISLGYDGTYISLNTTLDGYINIPEITLTGKRSDWGNQILGQFNAYMDKYNNDTGVYGFIGRTSSYIASLIGTTQETFYSFSGGANDPDKETLNKLRPGDRIEANNLFEYILNGYGRSFKAINVIPDRFQFGIDVASLLPFVSNSALTDSNVALIEQVYDSPFSYPRDTIKITKEKDKYKDSVLFNKSVRDVNYRKNINFYNKINFLGKSNWK
uniref:hypothetical protein n=1 Tax=Chryseobacterium gossypii TaxID=3231602 RepID=UPI0035266181